MTNFVTMRNRIADELARSDLDTFIGREINTAIKHYESDRFWWTEVKEHSLGNTVDGERYYALPSDFIRVDSLKITFGGAYYDLTPRIWEFLERQDKQATASPKGLPKDYALYGDNIRLYPVPDGAYALSLSYLQRLTDLSADTDTNAWMTFGEELIRSRASAAVQIKYLRKPSAVAEAAQMASLGKKVLSACECIALESLKGEAAQRLATGRLRTTEHMAIRPQVRAA